MMERQKYVNEVRWTLERFVVAVVVVCGFLLAIRWAYVLETDLPVFVASCFWAMMAGWLLGVATRWVGTTKKRGQREHRVKKEKPNWRELKHSSRETFGKYEGIVLLQPDVKGNVTFADLSIGVDHADGRSTVTYGETEAYFAAFGNAMAFGTKKWTLDRDDAKRYREIGEFLSSPEEFRFAVKEFALRKAKASTDEARQEKTDDDSQRSNGAIIIGQ